MPPRIDRVMPTRAATAFVLVRLAPYEGGVEAI
jgi:hypothetical protein